MIYEEMSRILNEKVILFGYQRMDKEIREFQKVRMITG